MFDHFLSTLSLVSRVPVKIKHRFDPSRMDFCLPLTGIFPALLGAVIFFAGFILIGDRLLTAMFTLICQYLCFNLFHLDGLLDTADAFMGSPGRENEKEKRASILKDPGIGVYAFFTGLAVLSLKLILLCKLSPMVLVFPVPLLAFPISGRIAAAFVPVMAKPFREEGLGALAKDSRAFRVIGGALAALAFWTLLCSGGLRLYNALTASQLFTVSLFPASILPPALLLALPVLSPLISLFFARLYSKKLGGYTGDAQGAAAETAELVHLGGAFIILKVLGFYLM
ncbi:adenosylcobinamide-GDP ribazoletransferase [Treponema sp. OttesenSCG-928-L16]|nr:adenosylcobinamide-GDP ribazoletransferase [Treponema sp. OttesenSCG-928-L16]